ncbi:solute carrier organic anion transporter family member 4C1-like [Amphiura filiformis]|uniref:solute carrier organic anion transporter family member 4C1-like n=1 Tax=Amphiura filiformis TaxID=82378 RepID=UPI003B222992
MEIASKQSMILSGIANSPPTKDGQISRKNGNDQLDINNNCGWFSYRPDCLHYCNNPRWLLFWTCLWSFTGGMVVNGITDVSITSIERRFELSSSKSALIPSIYVIPSSILGVLVGYFGTHGSKPRWLAIGAILQGIGCIIFTLPHFLTGVYIPEKSSSITGLCGEHNSTPSCGNNDEETISSLSSNLYIFILGQILLGLGSSSSVLLIAFIDESVKDKDVGVYLGISMMSTTLGPALGYIIGGIIIDVLYTDFTSVDPNSLDIDASSHQWIGAWWLGFLICGFLLLLNSVPLSCFPPQLPELTREEHRHAVAGLELASKPGFGQGIDDVPLATKLLLKNPIFILLTVIVVCEAIFLTGAGVFIPKFIEEQFGLSAGDASVAVGHGMTFRPLMRLATLPAIVQQTSFYQCVAQMELFSLVPVTLAVPITQMKCVPESLRAYAIGLESFAGRLLRGLPGPILMGLLIDNGCILWHEECGEIGKCWFHDRAIVSRNIVLLAVTLKIVVIGCYVAAIKCYRPVGEKSKYKAVPAVNL